MLTASRSFQCLFCWIHVVISNILPWKVSSNEDYSSFFSTSSSAELFGFLVLRYRRAGSFLNSKKDGGHIAPFFSSDTLLSSKSVRHDTIQSLNNVNETSTTVDVFMAADPYATLSFLDTHNCHFISQQQIHWPVEDCAQKRLDPRLRSFVFA